MYTAKNIQVENHNLHNKPQFRERILEEALNQIDALEANDIDTLQELKAHHRLASSLEQEWQKFDKKSNLHIFTL